MEAFCSISWYGSAWLSSGRCGHPSWIKGAACGSSRVLSRLVRLTGLYEPKYSMAISFLEYLSEISELTGFSTTSK